MLTLSGIVLYYIKCYSIFIVYIINRLYNRLFPHTGIGTVCRHTLFPIRRAAEDGFFTGEYRMVFSSLIFLYAFLPVCFVLCFLTKSIRTKNAVLLVFSLIFYAWGEPVYVLLLVGMSFFCWVFSLGIERSRSSPGAKRLWMTLAALTCIGAIGYFKYAGFICSTVNSVCGHEILPVPSVALPIGISFYTFQLLTYVIDVYRGDSRAQKSFRKVLLYAGLFYQCVAGPIVRYGDVEKEIENRTINIGAVEKGLTRFIFGLGKKAVFANGCGAVVEAMILSDAQIGDASALGANITALESCSALTLWAGMAFYMLQIYLDFSAYSDMAIGMGLMSGFHFKENFDYPYTSRSVTEFWRRWHISLGSFFRDYVYIPLGGNRKGKARQIFNMFVVWTLTGLWHGASWNFVLWGLYFFVLLVIEKYVLGEWLGRHKILSRVYLLAIVYFGWIFFRYTNMSLVSTFFKGMLCLNGNRLFTYEATSFLFPYLRFFIPAALACTPVWKKLGREIRRRAGSSPVSEILFRVGDTLVPLGILIISSLSLVGDSFNPFLYFQF